MDATRKRRTRDRARQAWYARCRQLRFARFLGFLGCAGGRRAEQKAIRRAPPLVSRARHGAVERNASYLLLEFAVPERPRSAGLEVTAVRHDR
jgi:hypothetical protein